MAFRILPLALTAACASASVLSRAPAAAAAAPGFVSMPIVERRPIPAGVRRRADDTATLYNYTNVAYMIELGLGTPQQAVRVQLDTGSNELWVDPDCTAVSDASSARFCASLGVYYPNRSSTHRSLNTSKTLAYGKGQADIAYVTDTIVVTGTDNSALRNVQFGVATASEDAAVPILGVGFGNGYNLQYDNLIDALAVQNATATRAFSLILGSANVSSSSDVGANIADGAVIFGGVDTKKFIGPLVALTNLPPQSSDTGRPWRYWVQLDAVGFTAPGATASTTYSSSGTPVVLDSGSTLSYLPATVVAAIANSIGSKSAAVSGTAVQVDCDYGDKGGSVDFTFGALTVRVPFSAFLWKVSPGVCALGALASDDAPYLLGDTFLRSVYVLFDQDNRKIYMAKAANCGTNEQALPVATAYNITGECTEQKASPASRTAPFSLAVLLAVALPLLL